MEVEKSVKRLCFILLGSANQYLDVCSVDKIRHALEVAKEAHNKHLRDDGTAYILHPLRVALFLLDILSVHNPDILCAALLHDVLEDNSEYDLEYIERKFGDYVGSIVHKLTKPDPSSESREARNRLYLRRLQHSDDMCKLVKLADKIDNIRDSVNCPHAAKRRRTVVEARDHYLPLAESLSDDNLRATFLGIMNEAIAAVT